MKRIVLFLFPVISLLVACGEDRIYEYAERVDANEWIFKVMEENYIYASSMPSPEKIWYALPASFFQSVRGAREARNGVYASELYVGEIAEQGMSYGYLFDYYSFDSLDCVRVIYVAPQSPAFEAGLTRGDWIIGFDGKLIGKGNYNDLSNTMLGGHNLVLGKQVGKYENEQPKFETDREVFLPPARMLTPNPFEINKVLDWCDRKVGYLMCNRFESGPLGENSLQGAYMDELRTICGNFSADGIKEIILDLRFTTGNAYYFTQLLGSMLVPYGSISSDLFFHIQDKQGLEPYYFLQPSEVGINFGFSSLYVIASSRTQGAAELLIQSLSPYMKVVIVGGKTAGQDLLTDYFYNNAYGFTMKLATRMMLDGDANTYSSGINAKEVYNEKDSVVKFPVLEFGNMNELLLHRTLEVMKDSITKQETPLPEEPEEPEKPEESEIN